MGTNIMSGWHGCMYLLITVLYSTMAQNEDLPVPPQLPTNAKETCQPGRLPWMDPACGKILVERLLKEEDFKKKMEDKKSRQLADRNLIKDKEIKKVKELIKETHNRLTTLNQGQALEIKKNEQSARKLVFIVSMWQRLDDPPALRDPVQTAWKTQETGRTMQGVQNHDKISPNVAQ